MWDSPLKEKYSHSLGMVEKGNRLQEPYRGLFKKYIDGCNLSTLANTGAIEGH